ncbi:hypothetical protein KP509_08G056000 [Ceratopteris richardii]|uniref:RRM domain-containing protein n=1 Tax=Ceratopteris richardii TaxID=49495 RepID=A0A8T2UCF3_CERRI|nr:hypothetical protein KP509_08G056000 [Ceratopteris richardii]
MRFYSDENETQIAYVRFTDKDSVRVALLLSGSSILDREVTITTVSNASAADPLILDHGAERLEANECISAHAKPTAINRAQEIVRSMLSRGLMLSKDTMRKAKSVDGDALKDEELDMHYDVCANGEMGGMTAHANNSACDNKGSVSEHIDTNIITDYDNDQGSQQSFQEVKHSKQGGNNMRINMQKCYKHVYAMNEKLQLGQRTMSALVAAQQGVAHAGSAVANNKFLAAGGVWVTGAFSRISSKSPNAFPHDAEGSPAPFHEHVQLTEMTTFAGNKSH